MAWLLTSHLEQISLCASSIAELPFPGPGSFTNALLAPHDITSLIRDTEQHEQALFHLAPPPLPPKNASTAESFIGTTSNNTSRRATVYGGRPVKNKAVAAVLGGELYQRTRDESANARQKGDVDVEVLLKGAERLAAIYPIAGATEQIGQLRRRHQQLQANIAHYEAHVAEQARELQRQNRAPAGGAFGDDGEDVEALAAEADGDVRMTRADLELEEAETRELEMKKRALEERVSGMDRDLGGLMR